MSSYSMTLVPIFLVIGAFSIWYFTREISALIMSIGFLPTVAGVTQYWWGPSQVTDLGDGLMVPDQSYLELAQLIGQMQSVGSMVSVMAFMVLAWRLRYYSRNGS